MMLLLAWASTNLQHELEVRTVLFASGTLLAYTLNAFVPIAAFPAKEAPHWRIGAKLYLGFALLSTSMFVGIYFKFRHDNKRKAAQARTDGNEGAKSDEAETSARSGSVVRALGVFEDKSMLS